MRRRWKRGLRSLSAIALTAALSVGPGCGVFDAFTDSIGIDDADDWEDFLEGDLDLDLDLDLRFTVVPLDGGGFAIGLESGNGGSSGDGASNGV